MRLYSLNPGLIMNNSLQNCFTTREPKKHAVLLPNMPQLLSDEKSDHRPWSMIQAYVKVNLIIYLDYCTTKNLPKDDSGEDSLLSRRLRNGCETSNL